MENILDVFIRLGMLVCLLYSLPVSDFRASLEVD